MAEQPKCPVCGKVGVPDYLNEDIVCPCCGTDLSIFRVIEQIPQSVKPQKNIWKSMTIVAVIATIVIGGGLLITMHRENQKITNLENSVLVLNKKLECVPILEDSIRTLNEKLANNLVPRFKHVVRDGESLWTISKRYYDTGTRYEEIANDNGLSIESILHVGDTIFIK